MVQEASEDLEDRARYGNVVDVKAVTPSYVGRE
jgi:hypothetical protein